MAVEIPIRLIEVIRRDLGEPVIRGRQPAWRCPFPPHVDRDPSLRLTPDGERFRCWGCDKRGNAVTWVMLRQGISFLEAVRYLNAKLVDRGTWVPRPQPRPLDVRKSSPPPESFSHTAEQIVNQAVRDLWSPTGSKALAWLLQRGFNAVTIRDWRLGFNPTTRWTQRTKVKKGILIPWTYQGREAGVKLRRPEGNPKYEWIYGSKRVGLYLAKTIRPGLPSLILEGEFDALLAFQEIGDLVNTVTLGSASQPIDQESLEQLLPSPRWLICYDNDDRGREGARKWLSTSARSQAISVSQGKDITEFFLSGGNLRSWIESVLQLTACTTTRHPTLVPNDLPDSDISVETATRHHPTLSDSSEPQSLIKGA